VSASVKVVAQVGAFKRDSPEDTGRKLTMLRWLVQNRSSERSADGKWTHDIINLKYGRDFLLEAREYDIVVVHCVFHPGDIYEMDPIVLPHVLRDAKMSPVHTVERWRKRLERTQAKYIFIFAEQQGSLSGWHLGELDGYTIVQRDTLTIYKRNQL